MEDDNELKVVVAQSDDDFDNPPLDTIVVAPDYTPDN
jgi:hypothetical protein